jgi:molybdopterin molybdotransferase
VSVYKKPRLGLLATGDELVDRSSSPAPGKIRDANSLMLTAAIDSAGAQVVYAQRVRDEPEALKKSLKRASVLADIVLLTGGVSVGPHDLVRKITAASGFDQLFWKVRQKPGKPLFAAKRADRLLFGLPGNPVSALNCFAYYVFPILSQMQGKNHGRITVSGILDKETTNAIERTIFLRVRLIAQGGEFRVEALPKQDSHMLSSIDRADGFILLEPGVVLRSGHRITVNLYPWKRYEELRRSDLYKR